ncbi:MAG: MAPEG family protein [Bdellovibrio sp.]|nr:MAPEG family protein [Bdellovibrio sp.]
MTAVSVRLVFPLCAMFILTFVVLTRMFLIRKKSVQEGKVHLSYFKTYNVGSSIPEEVQASRHFSNLFEAPVLYYLAVILGMLLPVESIIFLVLAWVYVAARALHAYVHLTSNKVLIRMRMYGLGWLILIWMWILILAKAVVISAAL